MRRKFNFYLSAKITNEVFTAVEDSVVYLKEKQQKQESTFST